MTRIMKGADMYRSRLIESTRRSVIFGLLSLALGSVLFSLGANAERWNPVATLVTAGSEVPVALFPADVFMHNRNDPQSSLWERIPMWQIELTPAPAVHPSIALRQKADAPKTTLYFQVASDRQRLYFRLRWRDPTADVKTTSDRFRDGVAVQFALKGDETSYMMGSRDRPVNIWYWRSDTNDGEDLAAGGPGSTARLAAQHLEAGSVYTQDTVSENNQWIVVLSRPLQANSPFHVPLSRMDIVPVNFAVWQGAAQQRDGHKNAGTGWTRISLKPLRGKN